MVGCGGMWQGVETYGKGGGRVWGACHRGWGYVVLVQAYSLDGGHVAGVGHVAWCGAMWQGVGSCSREWGHVAGGGGMSQGIGA